MKTTIYLALAIFLVGCTDETSTKINDISDNRIKPVERRLIEGSTYLILEVDGKEYLTRVNGGFIEIK